MAAGWLASFKAARWTKVLGMAPSIAEGAKTLWRKVADKEKPPLPREDKAYSSDPAISAVEKKIHALELRAEKLGEEIVLTSEIIDKLAEQHSELVRAVEILRARTRALVWACALLGLSGIALVFWLAAVRP